MRRASFLLSFLLWIVSPLHGQTEPMAVNADPSFEVATIKPSDPEAKG